MLGSILEAPISGNSNLGTRKRLSARLDNAEVGGKAYRSRDLRTRSRIQTPGLLLRNSNPATRIQKPYYLGRVFLCLCIYPYIYIIYTYMYTYIYTYIYIHIYVYIHIHMYTYISKYIHIHIPVAPGFHESQVDRMVP